MTFPLETQRLTLRRLQDSDAEGLFSYRSEPSVAQWLTMEPQRVEDVLADIKQKADLEPNMPGTWFQVGIFLRESNTLVGDCGLHFLAEREHEAELGISLAPDARGNGYATEALRAVIEVLFFTFGKRRLIASIDPSNQSSIRLFQRLGMRQEAHFRESLWFKGEWVDDLIFAMLRKEWKSP